MLKVVVDTGLFTLFYTYYIRIGSHALISELFSNILKQTIRVKNLVHLEGKNIEIIRILKRFLLLLMTRT